ncbi:hypothetical protein LOD99_4200 [Oopsacas minuta]|uniref:AIG1-type G domain-containing protein n=1 Tax=Oopsacas minuta TaxID=111878 RepID=A0AAV7JV88_9METZ|nr:hypothetical protein LOD99_4200 [Oopsacas minuta]
MNCNSLSKIPPTQHSTCLPQYSELNINSLTLNAFESQNSQLVQHRLIQVRENETFRLRNVVRIMLLGNSGCGKSSFIRFIAGNKINLSTINHTCCVKVQSVNRLYDMIEAPGFQSATTEDDWRDLVSHVNKCGGVDVFLIVLHASEEYAIKVYKELNSFERKYVEDQQLFWERAVIVFTNADSSSTIKEQEKNIQILLHDLSVDKLRHIVINAENRCLYVDSLNTNPAYQTIQLQALYYQIIKIQEPYPEDVLLQSLPCSMSDTNPMTTFGESLSQFIEDMNCEFDEIQFATKKKKKSRKMKNILNFDRIKQITKSRRCSVDSQNEEEISINKYKSKSKRKSSLKFVKNPLKRILTHTPSNSPEYGRVHSDQSLQPTVSGDLEYELTNALDRSLTLPDLQTLDRDDDIIKENAYAIELYEQNQDVNIQDRPNSDDLLLPIVCNNISNSEEEFYTPPQSPSELRVAIN